MTTTVQEAEVNYNIYAPLVHLSFETLGPVPALATEWHQPDPLTWQFKLQEGVQFHKGYGEVTAEDVAFNANYTIEENKPRKFLYSFVKGAKALDKYTVEFQLEKPFTPFLVTTAVDQGTWVVSKKAYEEMGADAFGRNPVGAGPFEFVSWESGSAITLKKFDKYYKSGLPHLEELVIYPVVDTNTKKLQLLNGELDFIDQPDMKDIPELEEAPSITVARAPGWTWNAIVFNLELPAEHPLMQKEVRQAIAHAIDREAIVEGAYFGNGIPDDNPLPPGYMGTDPGVHLYDTKANQEKAQELLAQAGFADGFSVSCIVSEKTAMRRQLEIIAEQLAQLGITVQIEQLLGDVFDRLASRDFEMSMLDITVMTPDPDSALYWFQRSGTAVNCGYLNPRVDELLDGAREESDQGKREEMYNEVVRLVLEDAPYIFTCHRNMVWAYHENLTGFSAPSEDGLLKLEELRWTA
jgi:peptide/nickel transport system substrate-binding protein